MIFAPPHRSTELRARCVCEKIWTCARAELGSIFDSVRDLRCSEHGMTVLFWLVLVTEAQMVVLKSRFFLPSPLLESENVAEYLFPNRFSRNMYKGQCAQHS